MDNFGPWNPTEFKLTTEEGVQYYLKEGVGITQVKDAYEDGVSPYISPSPSRTLQPMARPLKALGSRLEFDRRPPRSRISMAGADR